MGWMWKSAHAQAGSPAKNSCEHTCASLPPPPQLTLTPLLTMWPIHIWRESNCFNCSSLISMRCSASVNSSRAHTLTAPPFLPRHRPSVSDPKWNEAPYSPPHIERHDACKFHGVIKLTKPQATGNHTALFAATGCSSVPGWRQLRTLCTSRLAESYFRFALILLPPRA